jgi:hypothetical protein
MGDRVVHDSHHGDNEQPELKEDKGRIFAHGIPHTDATINRSRRHKTERGRVHLLRVHKRLSALQCQGYFVYS